MNTALIEKLDEQAWNYAVDSGYDNGGFGKRKRERFAELLLKECLSFIEELAPHDKTRSLDDVWTGVYEHFGLSDD